MFYINEVFSRVKVLTVLIENFVIDGNHLLLGPESEKHEVTIPFSQLSVRKCIIGCKVGKPFVFWKLLLFWSVIWGRDFRN